MKSMEQVTTQKPRYIVRVLVVAGVIVGLVAVASGMVQIRLPSMPYSMMNSYSVTDSYAPSEQYLSQTKSLDSGASLGSAKPVPVSNSQIRKITDNYLTTHVKNTKDFSEKISKLTAAVGGRVMNEYVTESSTSQTSNGTLTIFIPNAKVEEVLNKIDSESIKVVDRQVKSYEISQEYTDLERKLALLEETLVRIKDVYKKATTVDDILKVQSQMDSVINQIDAIKGRKNALNELSMNTQITIYFSTNEYDLPYVPSGKFEIARVFKDAVRGLVSVLDVAVAAGIWLVVFSPIWGGALLVLWILFMVLKRQNNKASKK